MKTFLRLALLLTLQSPVFPINRDSDAGRITWRFDREIPEDIDLTLSRSTDLLLWSPIYNTDLGPLVPGVSTDIFTENAFILTHERGEPAALYRFELRGMP